jgi:hypothetical protein
MKRRPSVPTVIPGVQVVVMELLLPMKWGNGAKSILIAQVGIARPRKLDLAVQSLATWN